MVSTGDGKVLGRPRDPKIDDAVLETAAEILDAEGYAGFSIQAVIDRAGVTRPAIYRRWPTRQDLVIAALERKLDTPVAVDSGCTRCDLIGAVRLFTTAFRRSLPPRTLAPLIADCAEEPRLYTHAMNALVRPLRDATREILFRAAARDDLRTDTNGELILDLLSSIVYYRGLFGHARVDTRSVEEMVDTLLQGIARDYDELLEASLRHGHGDHWTTVDDLS